MSETSIAKMQAVWNDINPIVSGYSRVVKRTLFDRMVELLDSHAEEARAEQREMCGRAVFKLIMQDGLNPTRPDIAKAVCINATGEDDE